jgi:hypothetical protein
VRRFEELAGRKEWGRNGEGGGGSLLSFLLLFNPAF